VNKGARHIRGCGRRVQTHPSPKAGERVGQPASACFACHIVNLGPNRFSGEESAFKQKLGEHIEQQIPPSGRNDKLRMGLTVLFLID
jgi:hypothetical protein